MLTKIEEQYLDVLGDYIRGTVTVACTELGPEDWERIADIAELQVTQGILWKQCGPFLKESFPSIAERIHQGFLNDVFRSVCLEADWKEADRILSAEGIPYTVMKGFALYRSYPEPRLRTMSDIDIIIRPEDRERSDRAMKAAGYKASIPELTEYIYERDVTEYEFHSTMMSEPLAGEVDYRGYFDRVWNHVRGPEREGSTCLPMEESFHFLYLFVHIAKHVMDAGMGFRSYMDLPVFAREAEDRIDWEWVRTELDNLELLKFAGVCETFCERWFGLGFPIPPQKVDEKFFEETTRKIMGEGIYGYEGGGNSTGYTAKAVRRSDKPYWYTAAGITWRRLFPRYDDIRLIPWYSFVNGRPWLLPAA